MCRKMPSVTEALLLGLAVFLILCLPSSSLANPSIRGSDRKLLRGALNVTTGWVEIFQGIYDVSVEEGLVTGILYGPMLGLGMAVIRTGSGLYETITFPIPLPARYRSTLEPEYVWGNWGLLGGLGSFTVNEEEPEPP